MAKDGGEIKIRIGADASQLHSESTKAAKALAGVGGQATKTGKQVDKSATSMDASARKMRDLSDGAENTKDELGELDSGVQALASALDVVDPRLGAAARGLGDMAGAAEGAMRLSKLQGGMLTAVLNPAVIAVTVAVGAAAGAWAFFTKKVNDANDELEKSEERLNATMDRLKSLKDMTMELAVANGEMTEMDVKRQKAMRAINDQYQEQLTTQTALVQELKSEFETAILGKEAKKELFKAERRRLSNLREEIAATKRSALALLELGETTDEGAEKLKKFLKLQAKIAANRKALASAQESAKQMRDALAAQGDQYAELDLQRRAMMKTRVDAFKKEMAALEELGKAGEDVGEREVIAVQQFANDKDAINRSFAEKAQALREEEAAAAAEIRAAEYEANQAAQQRRLDDIEQEKKARIAAQWEAFEVSMVVANHLTSALGSLAQTRLDQAMQVEGEMTMAQKKEAMRRWKIARGIAIADATLQMAAAMARAHKDYPFPASLAVMAAAGLAAGAAVANVASQPPPQFKKGGIVPGTGAQPIIAHGGEGVLTESATRNIGGQAGVDAINSGDLSAKLDTLIEAVRGGGGANVRVQLGHRQFDQFIKDDLRRPGSTLQQAIRKGATS